MIETFTIPLDVPETRASVSRRIDTLIEKLALFPPDEEAEEDQTEGVRVLRALLERYLLRVPTPLQLSSMPVEEFGAIEDPRKAAKAYWEEVDHIADWARRRAFSLIRDRILAVAEADGDPVALAMHLRQLIEVLHWAVFYQYGQTIAYNILQSEVRRLSPSDVVTCEELESFVRGAVAVSARRVHSARAAVGHPEDYEDDDGQVEELAMTMAKQLAVVRFLAGEREKNGEAGILRHVTRVQHAYHLCCGYVHVTPMLLGVAGDGRMVGRTTDELAYTATTSITSCLLMAELFCFRPEFTGVRFSPFLGSSRAPATRMVEISVPDLKMLKKKNQKIEFTVTGGRKILVYDPNSHS